MTPIALESLTPRELQQQIAWDASATRRLLAYLDARGVSHSSRISGATLAAAAGVNDRTWRKWVTAEDVAAGRSARDPKREYPEIPIAAKRAIICAAYCGGHR